MVVIFLNLHCPNFSSFCRIAALMKLLACEVHLLIFNSLALCFGFGWRQLKTECGSQFTNKLEGMFKVRIMIQIGDTVI